jgi:uncharacterized Fe-S radical SAM superfamily protein PflX
MTLDVAKPLVLASMKKAGILATVIVSNDTYTEWEVLNYSKNPIDYLKLAGKRESDLKDSIRILIEEKNQMFKTLELINITICSRKNDVNKLKDLKGLLNE